MASDEAQTAQMSAAPSSAAASLPECRLFYRIVADRPLPFDAFTQLVPAESVSMPLRDKEEVTLTFRSFDYEDYSSEGEWDAFGVVYARSARTGAPVAGGVIWSTSVEASPDSESVLERRADGLYLTVTPISLVEPYSRCRGAYVVKLGLDGELFADGMKVGSTQ